ncbi:MAG: insulinase family protein [Bacteroidales bacterium]|nr:insulinase family protein [Bacteroidales bacterium]
MKKTSFLIGNTVLIVIMALALLSSCKKQEKVKYPYETVQGDLTEARIYTLDNGLKVFLSVNKEEPRIQTYIAVRTGSKNDPAETTGLAHYLEHLMFKGTSSFGTTDAAAEKPYLDDIEARYEHYRTLTDPEERRIAYHEIDSVSQLAAQYFIPNEYDKLMSTIGAEGTNAYTSNDVTCYVENIPSNEIDNWAKIQSDRFKNMVIRGFHTELEAVYEEYNIGIAQDSRKLWEALNALLFPTHPYGTQTTIGTQEHLKNPSITNIKNYFNKWYRPNNVAICMAGDFNPDEVIATIDKYFGDWKAGEDVRQPEFAPMAPITTPRDTTVYGLEAENLCIGWRFDRGNSLQIDTLNLIGEMLNNGTAGLIDLDINQQMRMLGGWAGTQSLRDYSCFIMGGTPREGQSLEEVQALLLGEMEKLKSGDFSDDLLPSVINNNKLDYYNALESNQARANMFVENYINEIPWDQQVNYLDRISKITKKQIIDFANRHFNDNYVIVYKRQGVDANQKKIDKPQITPIPTNRDLVSDFVKGVQNTEVAPIQPRFVDFNKDLSFGNTESKIPYIYVQNKENGRFVLSFRYDFGSDANLKYDYAADYLEYLGTDQLSNEQIKQQFYKLACDYRIVVGDRNINVTLSGLGENMAEALALLENILHNAKVDQDAWNMYAQMIAQARVNAKLNQNQNFNALVQYGVYGPYNSTRNILTNAQLAKQDPQELLDLLKGLSKYEHTILYYGPMSEADMAAAVTANHVTDSEFLPALEGKHYAMQATPENEILIAPYDAKNIYMRMIHNEQRAWNPEEAAVKALFNEYYGGGMNTIVFQEMREARGLAYNAFAAYMEPRYKDQTEYFFTHIITQNDKMMDCVTHFLEILDNMPESEAAFGIAKEALTKRLASQRTTKFGLINAWLSAQQQGVDYDLNEKIYNALDNITLKDIVAFEQEQMAKKPYRYVILGNEKELDMKALQQLGPIRRVSTEEIFGY